MNLETNQDVKVPSKKEAAVYLIQELRNEGLKRAAILAALVEELVMTKANASYYLDRVAKKAA